MQACGPSADETLMTSIHLGGRRPRDTGLFAGGCPRRRAIGLALAITLGVTVVARTTIAQSTTHDVAFEMMPDDALSPTDERGLAQLRGALETMTLDEAGRRTGRRAIESLARRHTGLLLRWLLGDERHVALGYERGALLDVLVTSTDARARAVGTEALLTRPGLGYCMRALPPLERAGRLASVVRDLGVVEGLRREAARLLLTVGDPAEAARAQDEARAHAERIALDQPRIVRRWLLDETDVGLFDTYRVEVVAAFLASAAPSLRALASDVTARRARLAPAAEPPLTASITTRPALTAAR
jgi:hypothetical protein